MNILEAIKVMREGKKVKGKDWFDEYYCFYDEIINTFVLYDLEFDNLKELTIEEFTDLEGYHSVEELEKLEYEIVE